MAKEQQHRQSKNKQWLIATPLLLLAALAGGGYYYSQQTNPNRPIMQECLGRLTFDVPAGLNWGVGHAFIPMMFTSHISDGLTTDFDHWEYNHNLLLMVSPETEKKYFTDQWKRFQPGDYQKGEVDKRIAIWESILTDKIEGQKEQKARLAKGEKIHELKLITDQGIKDAEEMLVKLKQQRAELDLPVPVHQLSIPDAYTASFDSQWAFAWRQNRVYLFYFVNRSDDGKDTLTAPVTLEKVNSTLQRFSPRQLGETPKAPAFCYPYGSIADTGKEDYEIKNSFYFKDQPNVIYSIYTGTYRAAVGRKSVANYGLREPIINYDLSSKEYDHQNINETFTLGTGEKITLRGQHSIRKQGVTTGEPYDYVFTGQTQGENPFIGIQVIALNQDPKDGRPNHAPPLKETLKRLKPILNSLNITLDAGVIK